VVTSDPTAKKWTTDELRFATVALLALLLVVLLRNAWLAEDAYITFRTIDNWLSGYGLRWNISERVQTYTHPLWLFLLTPFQAVFKNIYFVSLFVSIVLSLIAVALVAFRVARSQIAGICALAALASSKAFVDYSTSGLENPLSNLLLVLFFWRYVRGHSNQHTLLHLGFLAALSALNRLDTLLFYAPALLHVLYLKRGRRALGELLIGFAPLLLWECFSLLYYGFLFPNTAYAKLNTGIPRGELLEQGGLYFLDFLGRDPLGAIVIAMSLIASPGHVRRPFVLDSQTSRKVATALGLLLYLGYVLSIGGCYMTGRFFATPVLCAVLILSQTAVTSRLAGGVATISCFALGLLSTVPPLTSGAKAQDHTIAPSGIADERSMSYPGVGLLLLPRHGPWPWNAYVDEGLRDKRLAAAANKRLVVKRKNIGYHAFTAGPGVFVVDELALSDPLLCRLPAIRDEAWRIGHFRRQIPEGYLESLRLGKNLFADNKTGEYYNALRMLTEGPLLSWARLRMILEFNLGTYEHLIDDEKYRLGGAPSARR
jgi:arabinofuranosyltransferase